MSTCHQHEATSCTEALIVPDANLTIGRPPSFCAAVLGGPGSVISDVQLKKLEHYNTVIPLPSYEQFPTLNRR